MKVETNAWSLNTIQYTHDAAQLERMVETPRAARLAVAVFLIYNF